MSKPDELDVDVRFLLANERTWLAWLRTSLTMLAAAVALAQLTGGHDPFMAISFALLAIGSVAGVVGYLRFRTAGRAIRAGRLPQTGFAPALITAALTVVTLTIGILYVLGPP